MTILTNYLKMKNLSDTVVVNLNNMDVCPSVFETQEYLDAETRYIKNWYSRLQQTKNLHFMRLCKLYYIHYLTQPKENLVYGEIFLNNLPYWKLVQWAACEMSFGYYHSTETNIERIVIRIRMELPFEHEHGRYLSYTTEKFENALAEHCPNMKGTVHDWHKVLQHVPHKILLYEDFFG